MLYGKCSATDGLNIRQGPGTSYADLGDLYLYDHVIALEDVGGWWHLTHAYRGSWDGAPVQLTNGQTVEARAAATNDVWCKASYIVAVAPPPLPPEAVKGPGTESDTGPATKPEESPSRIARSLPGTSRAGSSSPHAEQPPSHAEQRPKHGRRLAFSGPELSS